MRACTCESASAKAGSSSLTVLRSPKGGISSCAQKVSLTVGKLLARRGWRQAALALGTEGDGLCGFLRLKLSASLGIQSPECALKLEGVLGRCAEVHLKPRT